MTSRPGELGNRSELGKELPIKTPWRALKAALADPIVVEFERWPKKWLRLPRNRGKKG
jgi:hypothetical protein